ncbi:hypothetical protein LTS17_008295 [Exophiala oligosperma]
MGFGILEPKTEVVEGTVYLFDNTTDTSTTAAQPRVATTTIKHSADGKIVLQPQPSDHPDDPLRWPLVQRDFCFFLLLISLAQRFDKSATEIAHLTSYMLLVVSLSTYVSNIIARIYGKRGIFIVALALLVAADAWAARASTFNSLLGARCMSGLGQSVFEGISPSVITDLFFVHERGKRVGLFVFAIISGVALGVPISTQIITHMGLGWAFGILAIFEGVCLVLVTLFFHEPAFKREHVDVTAHVDPATIETKQHNLEIELCEVEAVDAASGRHHHHNTNNTASATDADGAPLRKSSLANKLSIYHGRFSHQNPFTLLWRGIALTFHPTIFWCALVGLNVAWSVGLAYTIDMTLSVPPYNFTSAGTANMYVAAWLGLAAGMAISASSDSMCKYLARHNDAIFEPEFRLLYVPLGTVFSIIGFAGWGWGCEAGVHWVGLAFFLAFMHAGLAVLGSVGLSYALDAHKIYSNESQVAIIAIKNLFPYGMGYYFVPWYLESGPKNVWGAISGIITAVSFIGLFFYVYGKRLRAFWMKHPYLGIETMH